MADGYGSDGDPPHTPYGLEEDPTPTSLRKEGKLRNYILERTSETDIAFADVLRGNPNLLNNNGLDRSLLDTLERIYPDIQVTVRDDVNDAGGVNSVKAILKIGAPEKYKTAELRFYRDKEDMRRKWSAEWMLPQAAFIPIKGCKYTIQGDTEIMLKNQIGDTRVAFVLSFAGDDSSVARSELEMILTRLRITDDDDEASKALTDAIRTEVASSTWVPEDDLDNKVIERMNFGFTQGAFQDETKPDDIGFNNALSRLKVLAEKGVMGPWARPKDDTAFEAFKVARKGLRDTVAGSAPVPETQPQPQPEGQSGDPFFEMDRIDIVFNPPRNRKNPSATDWVSARMVIFNDGSFEIFKALVEDSPGAGALKNQLLRTGTMIGGITKTVKTFLENSPRSVPPERAEESKDYQRILLMNEQDQPYVWGKAVEKGEAGLSTSEEYPAEIAQLKTEYKVAKRRLEANPTDEQLKAKYKEKKSVYKQASAVYKKANPPPTTSLEPTGLSTPKKNQPSSKYILQFGSPEEAEEFIKQIQYVNAKNTPSEGGESD